MRIYIIRHGQTNWNIEGRMQGQIDIPLNETGKKQAKKAKENLKDRPIDLVICSPLDRTKETAQIVLEGRNIPIIYDERLLERNFGKLEGELIEKVDKVLAQKENFEKYEVETNEQIYERVKSLLEEVKEKYHNKNILLVSHGGTSISILHYLEGKKPEQIIQNCEIKEYEILETEESIEFE